MSSILGPSGTPMVELGGERAWRKYVKGDVACAFQWLDLREHGERSDGPEPCMVLYPSNRRMDTGAYVIKQRNAHAYADSRGNPTPQLLGTAFKAAMTLGFDLNDRAAITRMVDVIVDAIPDLIRMPSEQPKALEVAKARMGIEASVKINGRLAHEEGI